MSKHTPGPWVARDSGSFNLPAYDIESTAPGRHLVTCLFSSVHSSAERDEAMKGDARLVAAAPELLEALEGALERCEDCSAIGDNDCCAGCVVAFAVIRKARGET